mmetsp:Transcript_8738/g.18622  ORF Transcript_8738/g.18622 Transcript_8738/m.18622 type:complete len:301 (-) Transcript_8738:342-1244(-)|eukprot:CAMPEP_0202901874 /NCGR_PEP_ID=MMETSP1392-20130828/15108_1 /ASSEMBLY_ACC=CAM_ASM_000868 /TAXON_ID=225041 /ORGANISM="Chlamydomonas chlamydogama, Strain SAG 11-48b" /LENGTH=300 /DNA_ID=CAMNT_0049588519 /DNA_START=30 /DNA_END=932 /DNA_ORIENTATION=+
MSSMRNTLHSLYKKAAEAVLPPLTKSQFDEKRVLTPEEFVAAGDYLVRACPTWSWEAGDPKKKRQYFPADKQFLVTRNVPCLKRATDVETCNTEFALNGEEEGWVATHRDPANAQAGTEDIPSIDEHDNKKDEEDEIPDIGDLELKEDDEAAVSAAPRAGGAAGASSSQPYLRAEEPEDNIVRTRTYDLYITYDQYYQVPRLWLVGYDETRHPLNPQQVLEDVSEEHARKTITVDPHPNLSINAASIHPCRHAEVMKKLVDNMVEAGRTFEVQHYLLLFLKFIASVVPTIQYDYTMSVGN